MGLTMPGAKAEVGLAGDTFLVDGFLFARVNIAQPPKISNQAENNLIHLEI